MQSQATLITGASSGFGKISVQMLAEQGHVVYETSRKVSESEGKVKIIKICLVEPGDFI